MSSLLELCAQQNIPFWAKTSSEIAVSTSEWQIQWWLDCHCWCKGSNYFGNVNLQIQIRKYCVYSSLSFLGPGAASTAAVLMPVTFAVSKKDVWMSRLTLSPKSAKPSACALRLCRLLKRNKANATASALHGAVAFLFSWCLWPSVVNLRASRAARPAPRCHSSTAACRLWRGCTAEAR